MDLIIVAAYALTITSVDFVVTEGLRTRERQRRMVREGASWTMNSRHLTGHAIDLAAIVGGSVRWEWTYYEKLNDAFQRASTRFGFPITWGGEWESMDGPHFELHWDHYGVDD